jgi:uncharacterized membrane protein YfhO
MDRDALMILMNNYPGWRLPIDGKPAQVRDYNGYLGAKMLAGEHSYQFYFLPTKYIVGASISLGAFILSAVVLLFSLVRSAIQRLRGAQIPAVLPNPSA